MANISKLRKKDRLATIVHLTDGILHNAKHSNAHVQQMDKNSNKISKKFNAKHAAKHSKDVVEHAEKLKEHLGKYKSLEQLEKELDGKKF